MKVGSFFDSATAREMLLTLAGCLVHRTCLMPAPDISSASAMVAQVRPIAPCATWRFADIHALVNLDVRPHVNARRLAVVRHGLDVLLEQVEIDDHARRGQNVLGHVAKVAARDAGLELRDREMRPES